MSFLSHLVVGMALAVVLYPAVRRLVIAPYLERRRRDRMALLAYELAQPPHKHKCGNKSCGFVWQHTVWDALFDDRAHNCPRCGREQRWKYSGNEVPG